MPLSPGFADYVVELIAGFGKVEVKRLFGGAGLYRNAVGFANLDDDVFFLKADPVLAADRKKQRSAPWRYSMKKDGTVRDIAHWSLPETAADDPDEAVELVRRSFEVAARAAKEKKVAGAAPAQKRKRAPKPPMKPRGRT